MTTGPKRINTLAAWDRNINPKLKVASVAVLYSRDTKLPTLAAVRIYFHNEGHARRWLDTYSANHVAGKLRKLVAIDDKKLRVEITQYFLDVNLKSALPGQVANQRSLVRLQRILYALDSDNYKIDWQDIPHEPRCYATREDFERAINVEAGGGLQQDNRKQRKVAKDNRKRLRSQVRPVAHQSAR